MAKLLASPVFQNLFQNTPLLFFVTLLVGLDPPADTPRLSIQAKLNTHSKRWAYFIEKSKALSIRLAFWPINDAFRAHISWVSQVCANGKE